MQSLVGTPFLRCFVRTNFLRQLSGNAGLPEVVPCYVVALEVVLNEAIRWMIVTEEGACFNSVPLHALCTKQDAPGVELADVCSWDALGNRAEIVELAFFRKWTVERKGVRGTYLFSVHFDPSEYWALLPAQLKIMHLIERDDGNFMLSVNNEMRWLCSALDQSARMKVVPESNMRFWACEE